MDTTPPQTGAGDQTASAPADTAKRKAEQTNGTHLRAKRNRYISIAWYDCLKAHLINCRDLSRLTPNYCGSFKVVLHADSVILFPRTEILGTRLTRSAFCLATNASAARSSVMDKCLVNDADI